MEQTPLISVIVPVYNSEKYLNACLDSIMNQEFDDFELILVDDGSTDKSPAICDTYAARDKRVRVFHKQNGGICEARNFGMEQAKGEYIAFADHDDIVLPGFLKENYEAAKDAHADVVKFGRKEFLIRDEKVLSCDTRQFDDECFQHHELIENFLQMRIRCALNCVWDGFFRKAFLDEHRIGFDIRYRKGGEDIDFCSRCYIAAERILLRSAVYYEHYIRIGISTSTVPDENRLLKFQYLGDNLDQCMRQAGLNANDRRAEYLLCVARDEAYPSIKYFLHTHVCYADSKKYISEIYQRRNPGKASLIRLLKVDRKWGLFAWLFGRRYVYALHLFVRANLLRKKVKGIE